MSSDWIIGTHGLLSLEVVDAVDNVRLPFKCLADFEKSDGLEITILIDTTEVREKLEREDKETWRNDALKALGKTIAQNPNPFSALKWLMTEAQVEFTNLGKDMQNADND